MTGNSNSLNESEITPRPDPQDHPWVFVIDTTHFVQWVFSIPDEEEGYGPDGTEWPSFLWHFAAMPQVRDQRLNDMIARLGGGGKIRLGFSRHHDTSVLVSFEVVELNATARIRIEVVPSLALLRQEWECATASSEDEVAVNREFSARILDALPVACLAPLPPDASSVSVDWIEEQLTSKGRPLSESHDYEASEVFVVLCEERRLLVSYVPPSPVSILHEWIAWVKRHVPDSFATPLLSCVTPPRSAPPEVVPVAIDDLFDTGRLSEIQVDTAGAEARLRSGFEESGAEALGWYQPYHRYDEEHWGIYLHGPRILDLGRALRDRLAAVGCPTPNGGFELALRLILEHELFHARMESFALGLELSGRTPIYLRYNEQVYSRTVGTQDAMEEAVANFVARENINDCCTSWMKKPGWKAEHGSAVMDFIDELYRLSPPGYRDWDLAADPLFWRSLACQTATGAVEVEEPLPPLEPVLRSVPATVVGLPEVPIFLAGDAALAERFFGTPTRREVERLLKQRGYVPRSGKGSHVVWQSQDGQHFTLPATANLSRLVFHNLLRHLGMSKGEYFVTRSAL